MMMKQKELLKMILAERKNNNYGTIKIVNYQQPKEKREYIY